MFNHHEYQAALFDLDGTLARKGHEVSPNVKKALLALARLGFTTGLCTGRNPATLQKYQGTFPPNSIHIVSGGAQVMKETGEVLWEQLMDPSLVLALEKQMTSLGASVIVAADHKLFGNKVAQAWWKESGRMISTCPMLPITAMNHRNVPIVIIDKLSEAAINALSSFPGISFKLMPNSRGELYADINAEGVNKAVGLARWCQITGVLPGKTVGFGDSPNDKEFLSAVGYAVAMGNATSDIKAIAKEITADCDDDGVARWVEKYFQPLI